MSLVASLFGVRHSKVPNMAHENDVELQGWNRSPAGQQKTGVYIAHLNNRPERRLVSFANLAQAIEARYIRSTNLDNSLAIRKNASAELEALREIRSNIINHLHSANPLQMPQTIARKLIPHIVQIIKSAERDYRRLGISTYDARKLETLKKLEFRLRPSRLQFAQLAAPRLQR